MKRLLFVGCLLLSSAAGAKDLANRLGVGFSNQFSVDLPSIQVQYYPDSQLGLSGNLGVDTESDNSKFGFMVKVYRIIFMEDNMNFYMGAGAGILSQEIANDSDSGFELGAYAGGEFFFSGLENLGFSFETGVAIVSTIVVCGFALSRTRPFGLESFFTSKQDEGIQ